MDIQNRPDTSADTRRLRIVFTAVLLPRKQYSWVREDAEVDDYDQPDRM